MQGYRDAQKGGGAEGSGFSKGTTYFANAMIIRGLTLSSTSWTCLLDFQPIFVHGDEVLDHELEKKNFAKKTPKKLKKQTFLIEKIANRVRKI
jgi:hypothetical protein